MKSSVLALILTLFGAAAAWSSGDFTLEITPAGDVGSLLCDLETQTVECRLTTQSGCQRFEESTYSCGLFVSDHDVSLCLGVEKNPPDPERNVTVVPCNSANGNQTVWTWTDDATIRPLYDPGLCLTRRGRSAAERSFHVETCDQDANQTWTYDAASKTIANSTQAPVQGETRVLDRYGQLITWTYNGSYKQGWGTGRHLIEQAQSQPEALSYPASLPTGADGALFESEPVTNDRMKMAVNNLVAPFGRTPFLRDFATFPGAVPAERSSQEKTISMGLSFDPQGRLLKGWTSTGMYAPPNQDVSIQISHSEPVDLDVRVNTHTDNLKIGHGNVVNQEQYLRSPTVSTVTSIASGGEAVVRSDMGGLILLESRKPRQGSVDVTIRGAVPAPHYDGSQSQAAWDLLCQNPAPWGEVEGARFVVTERAELLCSLTKEQLDALIAYYDDLVFRHEELSGFDAFVGEGKHRFVYDVQISYGYGHAGFPMMTLWPLVAGDPADLDVWGNGHELGHNFQTSCFSSRFGGEVTVNLFTVHSLETSFPDKVRRLNEHYREVVDKLEAGTLGYDDEGLFQQLVFLLQIRDLAGWEPYQGLYRSHREMSEEDKGEHCNTDQAKLDYFYSKISALASVDFTEHFRSWQLPVSDEAKAQVAALQLPQPPYDVSRFIPADNLSPEEQIVQLSNTSTGRYLFSSGDEVAPEGESDWLTSPAVVGTDQDYDGRADWHLVRQEDDVFFLRNKVTERYLLSAGEAPSGSEGGWGSSPAILGADENHDGRAEWRLIKSGSGYLLKNATTNRYLFSTGPAVDPAGEGGWLESPAVVGADANYYNRAKWLISGPGTQALD